MDRRRFLVASTSGLVGGALGQAVLSGGSARGSAEQASGGARGERRGSGPSARSTILFFLCGGASHIDLWDLKPDAPREYRGPFEPIETSAPGVRLCEHLPMTARVAHHLALLPSIDGTVNTNDHHAGYYHNLTGHEPDRTFLTLGNNRTPMPDDWPFMGSVVASRRPQNPLLPNAITLPHKPSKAPYTRPGQFAARLGVEFDPLYVQGDLAQPLEFRSPSLALEGGITAGRLTERFGLLQEIDAARRAWGNSPTIDSLETHQQRAVSLLTSARTTRAFDVASEPQSVRERYGMTVNGMSLLMARRLVEAEVPFVTVFWKEDEERLAKKCASAGGWDTHGNNFTCLKDDLLPEFDRCYSALIEDLAERGLLDSTLVLVTSEMGRRPRIGDPRSGGEYGAGRDHWTYCLTDVLAGGGIRGGQVYGSSDRYAEHPRDKPITPAHVTKTVYHAMGIDDLTAVDLSGRPYSLLDEGEVLRDLF